MKLLITKVQRIMVNQATMELEHNEYCEYKVQYSTCSRADTRGALENMVRDIAEVLNKQASK